jgi:acetyltransferase-like isoleucine patch superfamily enzyme
MRMSLIGRLLRWCPGAAGLLLRQKFYPSLLGSCGKGVLFGRFIDLQNAKNIHIGNNVVISNRCCLLAGVAGNSQSIMIEDNVFVGIGTLLQAEAGTVLLKKGTNLGSECHIVAGTPVTMGYNVLMAAYCVIGGELCSPGDIQSNSFTKIGDNVWLGARSQVLSAIHIGEGAIIGAHAMVNRDINAYGVAMGRPATIVRYRK